MTPVPRSTTPSVRLAITALAVAGYLAIGVAADALWAVASLPAAATGLGAAVALLVLASRDPDAFVSTRRLELAAFVFALAFGAVLAVVSPPTFGAATWLLVGTLVPLAILVVGRPRSLARVLARVEESGASR